MKCNECGVGRYQPVNLPYIRSLGSRVMVLPNAPASKCDMCGQVQFDPRFEYTLQFMLDQLVESPHPSKTIPQAATEPISAWSNVGRRG